MCVYKIERDNRRENEREKTREREARVGIQKNILHEESSVKKEIRIQGSGLDTRGLGV